MLVLNKENILPYLQTHYPAFDQRGPLRIAGIGDPEDGLPEDGLINYVFKVISPQRSIIVKQGLSDIRWERSSLQLPPDRNRLEYETLKLRSAIVPQYIPEVYCVDLENHVFIMEDVSYLPVSRQMFSQGDMIPGFGGKCAEYIAATAFYTSEFYLDTDQFRDLTKAFMNTSMRHVMEDWVFLRQTHSSPSPLTSDMTRYVDGDEAVVAECYFLRHKFMTQTEALIHADLHTSNIFANADAMKVIDMEYTFAGPCGYDVGYLMNNFLSQYCSGVFRAFPSQGERRTYLDYMLHTIWELYTGFTSHVNEYWEADAKEVYRSKTAFKQLLVDDLLPDVLGYAAIPGLCRAFVEPSFQEIEMIEDVNHRQAAARLLVILDRHLLLNRRAYATIEEAVRDIAGITSRFLSKMGR